MGKLCAVEDCQSGQYRQVKRRKELGLRQLSLFCVPKCLYERRAWNEVIGRALADNEYLCELHFNCGDIEKVNKTGAPKPYYRLKENAKPMAMERDMNENIEHRQQGQPENKMEGDDGPSTTINNNPSIIKAAQEEMGRLDILVCGKCHSAFHFIEEFQEHRSKEGACSEISHFRENANNEQKAQVWAFLLWKDSQIQQEGTDKDSANSWKLYQKWCKMDQHVRDTWVTAGKTIQTFTKISNAKMQDAPRQQFQTNTTDGGKIVVRKVIRNGQPEDNQTEVKKEASKGVETKTQKPAESTEASQKDKKVKTYIRPKVKPGKVAGQDDGEPSDTEYVVEKIVAKRFNTKKRCSEYLLKWEGFAWEHNTWEPAETVGTCKFLLEEFERNLAKQKEIKAAQLLQQNAKAAAAAAAARNVATKTVLKAEPSKPGPSTAAQTTRPMRSSKSKAMDQVKQWCGSMKDEDNDLLGKRRMDYSDSDSEEGGSTAAKRIKGETGSDEDWTCESEEDRIGGGRSDVIQRAFNRANAQSNGANRVVTGADLATSLGLQSPDGPKSAGSTPVLVANAKGVVKVDPKQMPNLTSGVYVMSRKDGIIKLDSSPGGKIGIKGSPTTQGVLMLQNRPENVNTVVRKQVLATSQANSHAVKVVSKPDGSQVVTQMKVIAKAAQKGAGGRAGGILGQKPEPVKIQPKPDPNQLQQIHVVTAVPTPIALQPRAATTTTIRPNAPVQRTADGRPLLPRPALRGATPTSVLGMGATRTPVRAPVARVSQPGQPPRQVLQKRVVASPQSATSPQSGAIAQARGKPAVLASQTQAQKMGVSPAQTKFSPKVTSGKPQSLLSPQQKLLMAKRKAQEAVGLAKAGNRGLLAGARAAQARGRAGKLASSPSATAAALGAPGTKPKESKLAEGDGLHMEFHEVGSEESSSDAEPDVPPAEGETVAPGQPDSPPRPFTLCPLTGRIIGPDGEPVDAPADPEPAAASSAPSATSLQETAAPNATASPGAAQNEAAVSAASSATTELVLPSLDSLTDASGIMRVEMSPGGTTGTIVQSSDAAQISLGNVNVAAPDLPCLDDSVATTTGTVAVVAPGSAVSLAETTIPSRTAESPIISTAPLSTGASSVGTAASAERNKSAEQQQIQQENKANEERRVSADETSGLVTITGEDGVVYQVAGHAEDGQTLLVTHSGDGDQSCVYVTAEQQGDDGSVLTLDHAVAEAVAQLMPDQVNLAPQFYVKEGENEQAESQMVMSIMDSGNASVAAGQEDPDQAQVVAQVVQAEEPTPGGTRRVVLLLPDGNLMMTEVDEEQYAALELDK